MKKSRKTIPYIRIQITRDFYFHFQYRHVQKFRNKNCQILRRNFSDLKTLSKNEISTILPCSKLE